MSAGTPGKHGSSPGLAPGCKCDIEGEEALKTQERPSALPA